MLSYIILEQFARCRDNAALAAATVSIVPVVIETLRIYRLSRVDALGHLVIPADEHDAGRIEHRDLPILVVAIGIGTEI
jgi:hypothetical protein